MEGLIFVIIVIVSIVSHILKYKKKIEKPKSNGKLNIWIDTENAEKSYKYGTEQAPLFNKPPEIRSRPAVKPKTPPVSDFFLPPEKEIEITSGDIEQVQVKVPSHLPEKITAKKAEEVRTGKTNLMEMIVWSEILNKPLALR